MPHLWRWGNYRKWRIIRRAYRLSVWNAPRGLVQATSTAGGLDFHEKLCELSLQYPQKQFVLCIQNDITKPEEATVYVYQNGEKN